MGHKDWDPQKTNPVSSASDNSSHSIACSIEPANGIHASKGEPMEYCKGTLKSLLPTKHEILCKGRSLFQIIFSHKDFNQLHSGGKDSFISPRIEIVREPQPKYLLILETSASMPTKHWRWIEKAANKFMRIDVPGNTFVSILTYAGTGQIGTVM